MSLKIAVIILTVASSIVAEDAGIIKTFLTKVENYVQLNERLNGIVEEQEVMIASCNNTMKGLNQNVDNVNKKVDQALNKS